MCQISGMSKADRGSKHIAPCAAPAPPPAPRRSLTHVQFLAGLPLGVLEAQGFLNSSGLTLAAFREQYRLHQYPALHNRYISAMAHYRFVKEYVRDCSPIFCLLLNLKQGYH